MEEMILPNNLGHLIELGKIRIIHFEVCTTLHYEHDQWRNRMDNRNTFTTYESFLVQYSEVIELPDELYDQCETRFTEVKSETTDDD